jgi:hypothetical protein
LKDFKTKFEHVEQEPVFEENLHGVIEDDEDLHETHRINMESSSDGSVDGEMKRKASV